MSFFKTIKSLYKRTKDNFDPQYTDAIKQELKPLTLSQRLALMNHGRVIWVSGKAYDRADYNRLRGDLER